MTNKKGIVKMILSTIAILGTISTYLTIDYSKFNTLFHEVNWFAVIVSLLVGGTIILIFTGVSMIVKEGILKSENIRAAVIAEVSNEMPKIITQTIEQNETYKQLDNVLKVLNESQDYWRNRQLTAYKIVRDIVVNKVFNDAATQKKYNDYLAKYFFENGFTDKELMDFKLNEDVQKEVVRLRYLNELNKLDENKNV